MQLVLKYKAEAVVFLAIALIYLALRIPNLTHQPIFADEAIYIRWAQVMRSEPTLRFLPLSDGKTPLFMWTLIPLLKIFDDPLFAGRFLSVLSGFITLLGVLYLGWRYFSPSAGVWAAFLVTITPYTLFFDRMALVDSMLTTFSIWSLNLSLLLISLPRLDLAMFLGYTLGGGLLTKPPGFLNILVVPSTILAFDLFSKNRQIRLIKLLGLWIIALTIAVAIYNILRLGPGFSNLNSRNQDYVFSPVELLPRPLDPFIPHLNDILDWFPKLLTWPVLIFVFLGLVFIVIKQNRWGLVILLWATVPLIAQMAFLKTFTARYLLFSIPPLLVIAGHGIDQTIVRLKISKVIATLILFALAAPLGLYFDYLLLTKPESAPLPKAERRGYLEDWTAGYGLKQIADYLLERKKQGSVVVGTEGYFGTLPDGLQIYLDKSDIPIIGGSDVISDQLRESAKEHQTYFVANKNRVKGKLTDVKLILEFPKAQPKDDYLQDAIMLYQVLPSD